MKLNFNKNIISGNNLLPFYFLPHALNISLFILTTPTTKVVGFPTAKS